MSEAISRVATRPADPEEPVDVGTEGDLHRLRQRVRNLARSWLAARRYVPRSDSWTRGADLEFTRELGRQGLLGISWPAPYGGGGGTNVDRFVVTEELLRAAAPVAAHWIGERQIGPAVLRHGTEKLKKEILPGLVRGEYLVCLGMSESDAGSDLAAVRSTAVRVDGGYRLTGRKIWTTGAHRCTHAYVLARTSQEPDKHEGLSEFVIDLAGLGVEITPIIDLSGEHHFNEMSFDGVFVPEHRLLGVEGHGWKQVVEQLSFERGGPERVLTTYPLLAELVATPAAAQVRAELGELVARLAALRQMGLEVARRMDAGESTVNEAAMLKYLGNAFEHDVVDVARDVLGGPGAGPDGPFGQALLSSPGYSLRGGSTDVLLSLIARQEVVRR